MKTKKNYLLINAILIIALIFFISHIMTTDKSKVFYVDKKVLYNQFQMTKEMKINGEKIIKDKKNKIDKLKKQIYSLKEVNSNQYKKIKNQINILNTDLQQTQHKLIEDLNNKVNIRIKSYMNEFAQKRDIQIILGSATIYVQNQVDITSSALNYINNRYNGVKIKR